MKLTVKNLGAISKAEVDLSKDLIVLTGDNNTGKTYLAYTIYCACNAPKPSGITGFSRFIPNDDTLFEEGKNTYDLSETIPIILSKSLKGKIAYFFSVEKDFFGQAEFIVKLSGIDLDIIRELEIKDSDVIDYSNDEVEMKAGYKISKERGAYELNFETDNPSISGNIPIYSIANVLRKILPNVFVITAERNGVNLFHKELSLIKNKTFDSLLGNGKSKSLLDFFNTRFNKYPSPIKDSLEIAQNLDVIQKQKSEFGYLADQMEAEFMDGKVQMNEDGDIQFKPNNSDQTLEIHLASSSVKSLASLSIFLRHIAKKGDFIIIDEPEANLHPNNQLKVARFLARLVNEGFKVMISTHSDYIMRELNSLIMLGSGNKKNPDITKELLKKYPEYNENQMLTHDQVGVHLFRQGKDVENVKVSETGFEIATIDETVDRLNETSQNIYYELFD